MAAARDRVEHLLARSPAVIYSFKATGDYAPTFISQNVKDLLGYDREEYLEQPGFLAQPRASRGPAAHREGLCAAVRGGPSRQRVPIPQEGRQLLLDQRRSAAAPRCGGRSDRGRRCMERHHGAQAARRSPGRRAGPPRAPAVVCACGHLQLQGDGRFRADLRQREHQELAWLRAARVPRERGFLARPRPSRRPRRSRGRVRPPVQERPPHGRVPVSQEGRHLLLGERRAATDPRQGRPAASRSLAPGAT